MSSESRWRALESPWAIGLGFCLVGPFVLPLLWKSPRYSRNTKIFWSLLMVAATVGLVWLSVAFTKSVVESLDPDRLAY